MPAYFNEHPSSNCFKCTVSSNEILIWHFSDFLHIKHAQKQLFQEDYFENFPCQKEMWADKPHGKYLSTLSGNVKSMLQSMNLQQGPSRFQHELQSIEQKSSHRFDEVKEITVIENKEHYSKIKCDRNQGCKSEMRDFLKYSLLT